MPRDRKRYLEEILIHFFNGEEEYRELVEYASALYIDEVMKIIDERGGPVTTVEKNVVTLTHMFGLDDKYKQEGREEGIKEGEHMKAVETARKLLDKGVSIDIISECTGLSIDDVTELKKAN